MFQSQEEKLSGILDIIVLCGRLKFQRSISRGIRMLLLFRYTYRDIIALDISLGYTFVMHDPETKLTGFVPTRPHNEMSEPRASF